MDEELLEQLIRTEKALARTSALVDDLQVRVARLELQVKGLLRGQPGEEGEAGPLGHQLGRR